MKLEHLAPYLPYGLETNHGTLNGIRNYGGLCGTFKDGYSEKNISFELIKPILRPLLDYSNVSEITEEMNDYEIQMIEDNPNLVKRLPFDVIEKMLKNHIDVFGLIEKGQAIDINTL